MIRQTQSEMAEDRQSLWLLTVAPGIWGIHFLLSYMVAAVWCGKIVDRGGDFSPVRFGIIALAALALAAIAVTGRIAWRKHSHGNEDPPHDRDTPEDRHRFLGLATLLLSGLSAIATIYTALAALFISNCF